jgi:hypothetical protein
MKWQDILKIMGPAVLMAVPGAQPFIPLIVAGVTLAEETAKPGAEKKTLGREWTKLGAETANTIAKKPVVPVDQAVSVYDHSVDAIVSVVNIVKANAALTSSAPDGTGQP